jgi:hypothetical protein
MDTWKQEALGAILQTVYLWVPSVDSERCSEALKGQPTKAWKVELVWPKGIKHSTGIIIFKIKDELP